jgi:hypothetical protein
MFPVFKRVSFDRFPLTGWSRFAIQTIVFLWLREFGSVNHMAKEYEFSPMEIKPEENMPFCEMSLSSGFSTERDEPVLSDDDEEYEQWNEKANTRRNSVNVKSILFMKTMQSSEMVFSIYVLLEYIKLSYQIHIRNRKI